MNLELDHRDTSLFKFDELPKHILNYCVTTNTVTSLDSEYLHTALGVSPYSVPASFPIPQ